MGAPSDLTTTADVKVWQGISSSDSDPQIGALVSASSRAVLTFLGRPIILPRSWSDRYDGRPGLRRVLLRNWPVIAVQSVSAGLVPLSAVSPAAPATGYALEVDPYGGAPPGGPQGVLLFGQSGWLAGDQGLAVTYTAGYQETVAAVVPGAPYQVTPSPSYGKWASDQGVVFTATGAALTPVVSGPTTGQYSVTNGVYTFAAADVAKAVSISFGYVPADLAQACIELVAQRMSAGSRVGVKSKSLGGQETVSYDTSGIPDAVKAMLQPYRSVLPL